MTSRQVQQLCSGKKAGDAPDAPPDPALVRHVVMFELDGETLALWRRAHQVLEAECGESLDLREYVGVLCRRALESELLSGQSRGDCADADADADAVPEADADAAAGPGPAAAATATGPTAATAAAAHPSDNLDATHASTGVAARSRRIPGPATLHAVVSCPNCQRATIAAAGSAEPLTPAQRDRALCDAVFIGDLASDALTRPTNGIPAALRRKVMVRDRFACVVPGCRSRHNLEVHHVVHRSDGGEHTMSNLSVWCFAHHQRLHEGKIRVTGSAPALAFEWRHLAPPDADEPFTWRAHRPRPAAAARRDGRRGGC